MPKGGPDGGDGGRGGDVIVRANGQRFDLSHLAGRRVFAAGSGKPGGPNRLFGQDGPPLHIDVPLGTTVLDAAANTILADIEADGQICVVARGGRGGAGTARLATPTHRTPREGREGQAGEARTITLRLSLMVDIAMVGPPNSGKSTLLALLTSARPRIEAWPFSTTSPMLGALLTPSFEPVVLAELPGLVEGSSEGKGLGNGFLVHAERAALLLLVIRGGPGAEAEIRVVRDELARYGHGLDAKAWIPCPSFEPVPQMPQACQLPGWNAAGDTAGFLSRLIDVWKRAKAGRPLT